MSKKTVDILIAMTPAQREIVKQLAKQADMDSSAFIRDLIYRYCEDSQPRSIPWPAMPGRGGDRRSAGWRNEKEVVETMIAYREGDETLTATFTAENAALAIAQGYSAQIAIDQTQVYLLGEDWSHEDIERVRTLVRTHDENLQI